MSTLDYARDVTDLARAALPVAYYDLPEYGFPPPPTQARYILDLHIKASRLRSLAAAQQALQLAFDAASIAVIHPEAAEDGDPEIIALLLEEPDVVLNLMWAGNGSLKLSFIIDPLTEGGRSRIRLIFYLGLGITSLLTGGALPAFLASDLKLSSRSPGRSRITVPKPQPAPSTIASSRRRSSGSVGPRRNRRGIGPARTATRISTSRGLGALPEDGFFHARWRIGRGGA
jgi:hypothetical protein